MENYKKLFEESNKKTVKLYKNKRILLWILIIFLLDVAVIGLGIVVFKQTWKEVLTPSLLIMLVINTYLIIKAKPKLPPHDLQEKAEIFASTVYYEDLITALKTKFQTNMLTDHLVQKYARINSHFNIKSMAFEAMEVRIRYKTYDEKLFVTYKGNIYYITGWGFDSDNSFVFYFEDNGNPNNFFSSVCTIPAKVTEPVTEKTPELEQVE